MKMYSKKKLNFLFQGAIIAILGLSIANCSGDDDNNDDGGGDDDDAFVVDVDPSLFLTDGGQVAVRTVPCTLSDGSVTTCLEIVAENTPVEHDQGPWCPSHISDGPEAGGIWVENGQVYDVDGPFIENMATFYSDVTWQMYDADGNIYKIENAEDRNAAANPQVGDEYRNFCVQFIPSWLEDRQDTYLIPITPVKLAESIEFGERGGPRGGGGPGRGGGDEDRPPVTRGVAFNGVKWDGPAALDIILAAYTVVPLDDAGGHINNAVGYHYHGDMGFSKRVDQTDGHAAMIGYALDGHGIYSELDTNGSTAESLDDCRGHSDDIRGYHYHASPLEENNFITCLSGAWANN